MVVLKDINSFGLFKNDRNPLPSSISFHLLIGKLIFATDAVGKWIKCSPVILDKKDEKVGS